MAWSIRALTTLRIDRQDGSILLTVVNFGAHPTVTTKLRPWDVSRDVPGKLCDLLESTFGAPRYVHPGGVRRRELPARLHHAGALSRAGAAYGERPVDSLKQAAPMADPVVAAASETALLPTRRWTCAELEHDRSEAQRRLAGDDVDISGWRETIGRAMTNRPDDMVRRHGGDERKAVRAMCRFHLEWTSRMLRDFESRPEVLETEVQAIRVGDVTFAANSSEFFTPLALDVRRRAGVPELMLACYANGRIGYLPDDTTSMPGATPDTSRPSTATSFPFTTESGPAMCAAMVRVIERCRDETTERTKIGGRGSEFDYG